LENTPGRKKEKEETSGISPPALLFVRALFSNMCAGKEADEVHFASSRAQR